jgi:ribosomal protein L11 methyltransferase
MKQYIQASITVSSQGDKDILIARLSEMGFEGFEEERTMLNAFIPSNDFDEENFRQLMENSGTKYSILVVEEENWNAIWEAGFEPVIVNDFCAVRADFHEPVTGVRHEIVITPKMSFGTGHHATTYMMIEQMESIDFRNKSVFDFGTGTGVLAILAERCGASTVIAMDNDEWSIANAAENTVKNFCKKVRVIKDDKINKVNTYDVILANINRHVIVHQLKAIVESASRQGVILLSGLLAEDENDIHTLATGLGLSLRNKEAKHNWICLMYVSDSK